jgi:hypothetical protein
MDYLNKDLGYSAQTLFDPSIEEWPYPKIHDCV